MAISTDFEFLGTLKAAADQQSWTIAQASGLAEALNVTGFEDFPIVLLDQVACEGAWENCLSALVSSAEGVWWPPPAIAKENPPAASLGSQQSTTPADLASGSESVVRRFFMCAKAPCVILASHYGDEYLRREVVRLGGYDVLSKSAPQAVITRAIEFAWFWSQHSATNTKSGQSVPAVFPISTKGPND